MRRIKLHSETQARCSSTGYGDLRFGVAAAFILLFSIMAYGSPILCARVFLGKAPFSSLERESSYAPVESDSQEMAKYRSGLRSLILSDARRNAAVGCIIFILAVTSFVVAVCRKENRLVLLLDFALIVSIASYAFISRDVPLYFP